MIRIAMWSGPRNISTAMMRAWENRKDTEVVDEPLYGPYLHATGKMHPMRQEVINAQGDSYESVIKALCYDQLATVKINYQKHMCHHLLPDMDLSFIECFRNAFLLRHPYEVVASYVRKHVVVTPEDLGFPQQMELFQWLQKEKAITAPVMDAKDILLNPKGMLIKLCELLSVPFDSAMLSWPKGYRESDGVWASHWYNRVIESTGFGQYFPHKNRLDSQSQAVADACMPYYEALVAYKVVV